MEDTAPLLRLSRAAEYLDIHRDTLARWVGEGRVRALRLGPRGDLRFNRADLDALLVQRAPEPKKREA